ncbi:hypothetical protein B0H13DRAFT_2101015 [Mycena leptocephala]|nr:hypothetical protein B0H13DRAFT_2101015 [Mycena leptocephala]
MKRSTIDIFSGNVSLRTKEVAPEGRKVIEHQKDKHGSTPHAKLDMQESAEVNVTGGLYDMHSGSDYGHTGIMGLLDKGKKMNATGGMYDTAPVCGQPPFETVQLCLNHAANKTSNKLSVFAVIIGIDNYVSRESLSGLQGAVNDARAFEQFLMGDLDVPASHIKYLENEKASQSAILSAFEEHFLNNPHIPDHGNTTMIFFFAGYGSHAHCPGTLFEARVEVICPVDERTCGADGKLVTAIPDYVLGKLLQRLADKKGNNITVILDCCHYDGIGRDARTVTVRSPAEPSVLTPQGQDYSDMLSQSYRLWSPPWSHVLLAACSLGGKAYESAIALMDSPVATSRGPFVNQPHIWTSSQTYLSCLVISRNPLQWNPQRPTGVHNKVPSCWNTGLALRKISMLWIYINPGPSQIISGMSQGMKISINDCHNKPISTLCVWTVECDTTDIFITVMDSYLGFLVCIGSLEGVRPGTIFAIHAPTGAIVCTLVAKDVDIHRTILVSHDGNPVAIPEGSHAAVVKDWKDKVRRAESYETADICLKREGDHIAIKRISGTTRMYDPTYSSLRYHRRHPSFYLLSSHCHFHYVLEHSNERRPLSPAIPWRWNLYKAEIVSDPHARYGFKICNTTEHDLYPYLFYFDPSKVTVQAWYLPASPHEVPLNKIRGQVCIGLGGEAAFCFTQSSESNTAHGYLKLFVSREYHNLGWIQQTKSPFDADFGAGINQTVGGQESFRDMDALQVVLQMKEGR